jgi:ubiquinone/menaquinone biosynthesis C-methylase UbiE/uncharacterized protein YbaR (Trm112 family)
MRADSLGFLCCPNCKSELSITAREQAGEDVMQGTLKCHGCEECFGIEDGLANLVFPASLEKPELSAQNFYDQRPMYDYRPTAFRLGIWSIAFGGSHNRRRWADRLAVREGACVLEVGVGNGGNLPFVADVIGKNGRLDGLDISSACLKVARGRMMHRNIRTELVHGNASYLPYKSEAFDAVLCVGGFNDFGEKKRAIEEMHRVAKAGAKVVMMDEGLAPDRERTLLGKYILMCMKAFANKPPVMLLPEAVEDLTVDWIYQRTFWVIEYRKKS